MRMIKREERRRETNATSDNAKINEGWGIEGQHVHIPDADFIFVIR